MTKIKGLLLSLILFLIPLAVNGAVATLRVAGALSADSYTYNFAITPGDTITLGIWINTDTTVNALSAYLHYDTDVLGLVDLMPNSGGVNLEPNTGVFDNILIDSGSGDTIDYSALYSGTAFTGDSLVATMRFRALTISSTIPIYWDFDTAANRVTEIDSAGTNKLTGIDTAYIYVKPDSVLNLRGYADVTAPGTGMVLSWSASTDTGVNGYLVYRADSTMNYSLVSSLVTGATTYTDSQAILGTTYFWKVTAADTDVSPRAESDLSDSTTAPHISVSKTISLVSLSGSDTRVIPGASIIYTLILQSNGFDGANNIAFDDHLDTVNVVFDTNITVPTGWTELFAHKETPDRSYASADFDTVAAADTVYWLRFKSDTVGCGDSYTFKVRVQVK